MRRSRSAITIRRPSTRGDSSSKECDIVGGTVEFPTKKLTDGSKWKINNGKAKAN